MVTVQSQIKRQAPQKATATAQAQPNIALVKYWGKRHTNLNLPAVPSLSITLDALWSRTQVTFDAGFEADEFLLNGNFDPAQGRRVSQCLDRLRQCAGVKCRARVTSESNFPTGAGLASSAAGFAALVVAAAGALGLAVKPPELSALARQSSGSAARSIFGGFVEMARGERPDGVDALARPLLAASEWPLEVVVAVTAEEAKLVGSTAGMELTACTSPYYPAWIETASDDLDVARQAVRERDFAALAEISEYNCLKMHGLALAARPGLIYWNGATVECMHRVRELRARGVPVFFTVDAGPQVKAVCVADHGRQVAEALGDVAGVKRISLSGLGEGARLVD
jgi:diphosphomevalonate decarboxylase